MIVGTAGHVDHGKTALVRALTGVDTDRLKEEKARGITVDLGFAYLPGRDGVPIGFVDVPGHERLVRTMIAGAVGIDFALIAVAADDGVMPQTREHIDILGLLGVERGVFVVTKCDRADTAQRLAVAAAARAAVSGSPLAFCDVLFASVVTGEGVDTLREALIQAAAAVAARTAGGLFRLPVDRVFNLAGIGTVVTGTALAGQVAVGDDLVVLPGRRRARVRSLHAQNRDAPIGRAGQRCALALAGPGIGKDTVGRGAWVCAPGPAPFETVRFDADLRLLAGAQRPLRDWTPVHLHCGASDVPARLVPLAEGAGEPPLPAQIVLAQPLPLRHGDRFVLRDGSGQRTIGGGTVLDPRAPQRKRRSPERMARLAALRPREAAAALANLLALDPGFEDLAAFAADRGLASDETAALRAGRGLVALRAEGATFVGRADRWRELGDAAVATLARFHADNPELPGLAGERLRLALPLPKPLFAAVRDRLLSDGRIAVQGHWLHLPDHVAELGADDRRRAALLLPLLAAERFKPPRVRDIGRALDIPEADVRRTCKALVRTGELVEVAHDHFFTRPTVAEMAGVAAALTRSGPASGFSAADFRDRLDNGRKVAIQILEYFDRHGLTHRAGDLRRVVKAPALVFGGAPDGTASAPPGISSALARDNPMGEQDGSALDWFDQGREARLCHTPKEANPYPPGEPSHTCWNRGWDEANDPDERAKGYG